MIKYFHNISKKLLAYICLTSVYNTVIVCNINNNNNNSRSSNNNIHLSENYGVTITLNIRENRITA